MALDQILLRSLFESPSPKKGEKITRYPKGIFSPFLKKKKLASRKLIILFLSQGQKLTTITLFVISKKKKDLIHGNLLPLAKLFLIKQ